VELPAAARRLLMQQPPVTGYVGSKVYKHKLWTHVDQTGGRAVVVRLAGGWDTPDRVQTSQFPILAVDCWADCSRDQETGDKLAEDALDNAWAVYRVVDPVLHRVRNALWGSSGADPEGAYVVESSRYQEPYSQTKDEAGTAQLPYAVDMGESAVVTAQYAVHLA
jgi:hypothetical protein